MWQISIASLSPILLGVLSNFEKCKGTPGPKCLKTNVCLPMSKKGFMLRNWLVWLWKLRSARPAVGKPEPQESWWCEFQPKSKVERKPMTQLEESQAEKKEYLAFYSSQAFNGLDETHPLWGGPSALPSLLIQRLTSSKPPLPEAHRRFNQTTGLLRPSQADTWS